MTQRRAGEEIPAISRAEVTLGVRDPASLVRKLTNSGIGTNSVGQLLSAGLMALDLLNIGLVVCGADGQMLVANDTAQEMLRVRDGVELDANGMLAGTHESSKGLGKTVRQVARSARTAEAGTLDTAFALRRASGKRALTVFVRAVNSKSEKASPKEAAVLVMILDAALPVETREAELRQLYGFTAMEAQVSNLLMEGASLEDVCAELGIRRTTVRMHLRNIFAKTGVRRQGELVSLLLKSIGLGPKMK